MITRRDRDLFGPRRRGRFGVSFPVSGYPPAWAIAVVSVLLPAVAVLAGWLMRAVILDVLSLWPAPLAVIAVIAIRKRVTRRPYRAAGPGTARVVSWLVVGWVAVGVALHLAGWGQLPSMAVVLQGPPVPDLLAGARLEVRTAGEVVMDGEGVLLYEVTPIRRGGSIAPAEGSDLIDGGRATVRLTENADAGWFGSSGWMVSLSGVPEWDLVISASRLEADLTAARLLSLRARADGRIRLGSPSGDVPVHVEGELVLEVPLEATVEIEGRAEVGPEWEVTAAGTRYLGTGDSRYVVLVEPGSDLVVEQR